MPRSKWILLAWFVALAAVTACAHQRALSGQEQIVERSGKKPGLVAKNQWSDLKSDPHKFVGMMSGAKDLDVAIREAEVSSRQRIVESVIDSLRSVGSSAMVGAPTEHVGRYLNDVFTWVAGTTEVTGAHLRETYWEKLARRMDPAVEYSYRAYAITEISRDDFKQTKINALRKVEARAQQDRDAEAEEYVRRVIERLLGGDQK
jgi:hypothetical protein